MMRYTILNINGAELDRTSGNWATVYRRHDYHWQHGFQRGSAVVAVLGDCASGCAVDARGGEPSPADPDPRVGITPLEEACLMPTMRAYRVRVTRTMRCDEDARRAVYAHLTGHDTYLTYAGRRARVRIVGNS